MTIDTGTAQRPIGRSGLTTSMLALGCPMFGREIDEPTSCKILDYAMEKHITFFDTAEAYGGGNSKALRKQAYGIDDTRETTTEMHSSEKIIGRWLKKRNCRDRITLCTKVSSGASPENIRRQLTASCQRLDVEGVDIYMLHKPSPEIPIAETLDALTEMVRAGRTKVIGVSNFSPEQLTEALDVSAAHGYERIEIVQPCYNLLDRSAEAGLLALCRREQIAVSSYSPLAAGFLSGKYTPDRSSFPPGSRFHIVPAHADVYFSEKNFRIVEHLRQKSEQLNIPMVQLALFWVLTHPDITACIIGATKIDHINNALSAMQMPPEPQLRAEMSVWK